MRRTLLLIEDDPDIREIVTLSLGMVKGWEVVLASSGSEGIARAREHEPDAIVLDVMMPEMDGPTTLGHLRDDEATRSIPVLFLTAKVQASEQERFRDLGVDGIIAKPFDPMTLGDRIAEVLGWDP